MNTTIDLYKIRSGVYGLCVADALGVPAEFMSREALAQHPVTEMRTGTHHQPKGTWSDDSSMALALLYSLFQSKGLNYSDIMGRFKAWYRYGEYSPWGECFDIGGTCEQAIRNSYHHISACFCGGDKLHDNGNGSLMRILPLVYELYPKYGSDLTASTEAMEMIHNVSGLTHRHPIAQSACGIYLNIASRLLDGMPLEPAIYEGVSFSLNWYSTQERFAKHMNVWDRISNLDLFRKESEFDLKSGGYVVETLEATLWGLLNTDSYCASVEKVISFGHDTDTTGAVTGGLAGLAYGYASIPQSWLDDLVRKDMIDSGCDGMYKYISRLGDGDSI